MSFGVFNEGLRWIYDKAFRNQNQNSLVSVGLYTNPRASLSRRSVYADIVPCPGAGYAAVQLSAAGWSTSIVPGPSMPDDVCLLDRANELFTASVDWGIVTGGYIFHGTTALMWRDFDYDYDLKNQAIVLIDFLSEAG